MAGSLLGAAALVGAPLVSLRASRLVPGFGRYGLTPGDWPAFFLLVLWASLAGVAILARQSARRAALLAGGASAALVLLALAVRRSAQMWPGHVLPVSRVSLSWGFWLGLAAIYVVAFSSTLEPKAASGEARSAFVAALWAGVVVVALLAAAGRFSDLALARELAANPDFEMRLAEHIQLAAVGVAIGTVLGVPIGVFAARRRQAGGVVVGVVEVLQTVPSLALLGLLIAPLGALAAAAPALAQLGVAGIGPAPAYVALSVYGLLPLVRNTYTALTEVDPALLDAGRGMGMTSRELLWRVELPVARPLILEGLRTSAVQLVGIAALMALIDAGGLGTYIFRGIGQGADDMVLLGALPIVALAVVVDRLMGAGIRVSTPRGLRRPAEGASRQIMGAAA